LSSSTRRSHSCRNHYIGGETRLQQVLLSCGKSLEIHQNMMVRVAMRLEMTIEEFYDETDSVTFANRLALLLGVPKSKIRVAEIQSGSVVVNLQLDGTDSQDYDTLAQKNYLDDLADKLRGKTKEELEASLGVPVADVSIVGAGIGSCSPAEGNATYTQENVTAVDPSLAHLCSDIESWRPVIQPVQGGDDVPGWGVALIVIGVLCLVAGIVIFLIVFFKLHQKCRKEDPPELEAAPPPLDAEDKHPHELQELPPGDTDLPDIEPPPPAPTPPDGAGLPPRQARKSETDGPKPRTLRISLDEGPMDALAPLREERRASLPLPAPAGHIPAQLPGTPTNIELK